MRIKNVVTTMFLVIVLWWIQKRPPPPSRIMVRMPRHICDRILVIKCVVPNSIDDGGFAWHLHQVLCAQWVACLCNLQLVVRYTRGYYYDAEVGDNWWTYFFKPLHPRYLDRYVDEALANNRVRPVISIPPSCSPDGHVHLYTQYTFQKIARRMRIDFGSMQKTYIHLRKPMRRAIDAFAHKHFRRPHLLGVHYRGTDKYANHNGTEDMTCNKHHHYEAVSNGIRTFLNTQKCASEWDIFLASDEEPFVKFMVSRFPRAVAYDATRSSISTSGLELVNTRHCTECSTEPQCLLLRKLASNSIHRGHPHIRPLKKGRDAVMDIWLLARCEVLFRNMSGGNFCSRSIDIAPSTTKVYTLADDGSFEIMK